MLAAENLNQTNSLPPNMPEEILADENNSDESVTFSLSELKYFVAEMKEMMAEGKTIDIPKAIHNAKYFANLEPSIKQLNEGRGQKHDLIEV